MIVKDETRVIRRCLDSVRPFITSWVIVDTGSTDGTQEMIRRHLADVPGELHERGFRNFGYNRSEAIQLARDKADYLLFIDADEELVSRPGFRMPGLTADEYMVPCQFEDIPVTWFRTTLVRSTLGWRYEGVLHEYVTCDAPHRTDRIDGLSVLSHTDGARNADPIRKFEKDAEVLEGALKREPENRRYAFYLAQSYRDSRQWDRAIDAYERRIQMGGWDEEVFTSMLRIADIRRVAGHDRTSTIGAYLRAYQYRPTRCEPLYTLAFYCRAAEEWALAELFARGAVAIRRPPDILLVDESAYEWRALDELSIAAYYVGKYEESAELCRRLLGSGKVPIAERPRVEANLKFATDRLEPAVRQRRNDTKRKRRGR